MKWLPMDQAPKDGSEIIYANASNYVGITHWAECDIYTPGEGYTNQWDWFDYYDDGIVRALDEEDAPIAWQPKPVYP